MNGSNETMGSNSISDLLAEIRLAGPDALSTLKARLDEVDVMGLARERLADLARDHLRKEGEVADEIGSAVPHFGHLLLMSADDIAFSISVRWPLLVQPKIVSTSGREEYHRVVSGQVALQALAPPLHEGEPFSLCESIILESGQSMRVAANSSATILSPLRKSVIFSVSGSQTNRFNTNVDRETGKIVGRSLSDSRDSILCNVLELCCRFPVPELASDVFPWLDHVNHRVRLAAFKALASLGGMERDELLRRCELDPHPLISGIAVRARRAA